MVPVLSSPGDSAEIALGDIPPREGMLGAGLALLGGAVSDPLQLPSVGKFKQRPKRRNAFLAKCYRTFC